jgi:hypothetical protein
MSQKRVRLPGFKFQLSHRPAVKFWKLLCASVSSNSIHLTGLERVLNKLIDDRQIDRLRETIFQIALRHSLSVYLCRVVPSKHLEESSVLFCKAKTFPESLPSFHHLRKVSEHSDFKIAVLDCSARQWQSTSVFSCQQLEARCAG